MDYQIGSNIDYADELTLLKSLEGRKKNIRPCKRSFLV